jgi:hypothetical protein
MSVTVTLYPSFFNDVMSGSISLSADTIKLMLATSSYTYSAAHDKRNDITNEVANGNGYTTGGAELASKTVGTVGTGVFDAADVSWSASTITARYGVIYKSRGGASSADELVALIDFGGDVSSTADTFTVTWNASGILTLAQA